MERRTVARWLLVSALACFGFLFAANAANAETTVQGTQTSTDSEAETGTASGENNADFAGGPAATGDTGASSQQLGDNTANVSQSGTAESGDPVAGAQVTGVVADDATVQNTNNATNPVAVSGDADVVNDANVTTGPSASTDDGTAQTSQVGSNDTAVSQFGAAATGDAVAGGQITGIVGDGEHVVQNTNNATDAFAESGDAEVVNLGLAAAGPTAFSTDGVAQTGQIGDNDAVLTQSSEAESGDAVASSQVTGIVGGSATVQNQGSSEDGFAASGDTLALNVGFATAAPNAASIFGTSASASQTGDNTADVAQDAQSSTGDALAGSQVTGAVGDQGGFLTVQNQQASDGDFAVSGDAEAVNIGFGLAGPNAFAEDGDATVSQIGDNDVAVAQVADGTTGDALAGGQVVGAVGHGDVTVQQQLSAVLPFAVSGSVDTVNFGFALSGPSADSFFGDASASQVGDNTAAVAQEITGETGDAVAGGQVTGIVATGDVVVQNTANTEVAFAVSGELFADNLAFVEAGPSAIADGDATVSQTGDNAAALAQVIDVASGDAVAGGQVTGVVADGDVTVQNTNVADFAFSVSGEVDAVNDGILEAGPTAVSFFDTASASQIGDNDASADQVIAADSGDAVAGSQVTGVVAGGEAVVQNTNTSEDTFAFSGDVFADNLLDANLGPSADADGVASASQVGDNFLDFGQDVSVGTGDAVAGSQVTGVVAPEATIQVSNNDFGSFALSGNGFANNAAAGSLTAEAFSATATASASTVGDTGFVASQTLSSDSGDAVAGAQVTGDVS